MKRVKIDTKMQNNLDINLTEIQIDNEDQVGKVIPLEYFNASSFN